MPLYICKQNALQWLIDTYVVVYLVKRSYNRMKICKLWRLHKWLVHMQDIKVNLIN